MGCRLFELERKEIRGSLFPLHLKGLTPGTVGEATDLSSKHSREQIDRSLLAQSGHRVAHHETIKWPAQRPSSLTAGF